MVLRPRVFTAMILLLAGACTAAGADLDGGMLTENTGSLAMIRLVRPESADPSWTREGAELRAAFVHYRGVNGRTVLTLVGGHAVDLEECRVVTEDAASVYAEPNVDVELLDLGEINVEVAGAEARALPRTFPDLAGVVRGAFYAEEATLRAAYAEDSEYRIHVAGVDAHDGFEASVFAPSGFANLWLDGELSLIEAPSESSWELVRGADIEVRWDAGDPGDRVEFAIIAGGAELQCAARDDGHYVIPGELSVTLPTDSTARFIVRRVRREPIVALDFDTTWASVATERIIRVPIR